MRRIYQMLSMALVLLAVSFNSQTAAAYSNNEPATEVWLYGKINGAEDWKVGENNKNGAIKLDKNNLTYTKTITITQLSYFRIYGYFNYSNWNTKSAYWAPQNNDNNVSLDNQQTEKTWYKSGSEEGKAFTLSTGTWKITVTYNADSNNGGDSSNVFKIKAEKQENNFDYYIHSNITTGSNEWKATYKFNGSYTGTATTLTCTQNFTSATKASSLGIRRTKQNESTQESWYNSNNSASYTQTSGQDFPISKDGGNNINFPANLTGNVTFTLTVNAEGVPTNLNIKGGTIEGGDTPTPGESDLYIMYDGTSNVVPMTKLANGHYTVSFTPGSSWFRFVDSHGQYYNAPNGTNIGENDYADKNKTTYTSAGISSSVSDVWNVSNTYANYVIDAWFDGDVVKFNIERNIYFLVGNMNKWAGAESGDGRYPDTERRKELDKYHFVKVTTDADKNVINSATGESDYTQWYVLDMKQVNDEGEYHGQFQILEYLNFHTNHWGHSNGENDLKNNETNRNNYLKNTVAHWDGTTLTGDKVLAMRNSNKVLRNCHLSHNYYKNCKIYFKRQFDNNDNSGQVFLTGEPRDMYVYYFDDNASQNTNTTITVHNNDANQNELNYWTVVKDGTMTRMGLSDLSEAEKADPAIAPVWDQFQNSKIKDNEYVIYRYQVIPGMEEEYTTGVLKGKDNIKTHHFNFSLEGAPSVPYKADTYPNKYDGDNIYFIDFKCPTMVASMNVQFSQSGNLTFPMEMKTTGNTKINSIKARFLTIVSTVEGSGDNVTVSNKVYFVDKNGALQEKRTHADVINYVMDVPVHGETGFDRAGKWYGFHNDSQPKSVVANETTGTWVDKTSPVPVAHVNRFVELEVNADVQGKNQTAYFSDFNYDDSNNPISLKDSRDYKFKNRQHLYMTGTFEGGVATGIDEIEVSDEFGSEAEEVAPVYYNLQGMRVANPVKGNVYIRVAGQKSQKVMF